MASPQGSLIAGNTLQQAAAAAVESLQQPPPSFSSSTYCSVGLSSERSPASSVGSDSWAGDSAQGAQGLVSGIQRKVVRVTFGTFLDSRSVVILQPEVAVLTMALGRDSSLAVGSMSACVRCLALRVRRDPRWNSKS